jgi:hypothetical protein
VSRGSKLTDGACQEGDEAPETVEAPAVQVEARAVAPAVRVQREAVRKAAEAKLRMEEAEAELAKLPEDPVAAAGKYHK